MLQREAKGTAGSNDGGEGRGGRRKDGRATGLLSRWMRSWMRALALFFALGTLSCVGPVAALLPLKHADETDVVYTPEAWPTPMKGDVYRPKGRHAAPAVLMIHGDGRIGDDGRWQMAGIARQLADEGYYVFNITYRMAPEWTHPAPLEDVRAALDWMVNHAEAQGIRADRMAVFGYSAGGYAGSLAALTDPAGRVKAVVTGGSPSDLTYYAGGRLIQDFLGGTLEQVPRRYHEASPVNHVRRGSPPFFLYHGDRDTLVNPDHLLEMERELKRYQVPHEIHWVRGKGHVGAFLFPDGAIEKAVGFLDETLKD